NNITSLDGANIKLRASIDIALNIAATDLQGKPVNNPPPPINQTIQLYGPGDIIGIDAKAIVRTEPRNLTGNFESNYLPYVEFYEEDFPWRYTPATPELSTSHLRPWLTLVVLKENEFEDGKNSKDRPLPFFNLKEGKTTLDLFPPPGELWAWAHVHANTDLSNDVPANTANDNTVNDAITNLIQTNPDQAYSRILCPRKLSGDTAYYAFLIPTFENGRLAGLGFEPQALKATTCAWDEPANLEFPYYYRWYFRTGPVGDFESLVNLLKPKIVDKTVGVRDMDMRKPGSNLPPITTDPGILLKLGGALRAPLSTLSQADRDEVSRLDTWGNLPSDPHLFMKAMANR
ncbi:MAG TPA: hypothetical protein VKH37_09775, partial [Ferruginibacter sp.]|nr:hypothetical protein [Ferruginibacter sp.]